MADRRQDNRARITRPSTTIRRPLQRNAPFPSWGETAMPHRDDGQFQGRQEEHRVGRERGNTPPPRGR